MQEKTRNFWTIKPMSGQIFSVKWQPDNYLSSIKSTSFNDRASDRLIETLIKRFFDFFDSIYPTCLA